MRSFIYIIFLCLPLLTTATIYKSYDKAGNPVFSDTYSKGATEVEIGTSQTYNETQRSSSSISEKSEDPAQQPSPAKTITYKKYEEFKILQPVDDETVRQSERGVGIIHLEVAVQPALQENDTIIYYLDGNQVLGPTTATDVNIGNIDRGEHSLQAKITRIDSGTEKTKVVASSNTVTVYLRRHYIPIQPPTINPLPAPINPAK